MIEAITEDNKLFNFFMKDPDYAMKIMASWTKIDELECAWKRRDFVDSSGTKEMKQFTHCQPSGIHFRYRNHLDDHNNQIHSQISLDREWVTNFWPACKFAWYLAV